FEGLLVPAAPPVVDDVVPGDHAGRAQSLEPTSGPTSNPHGPHPIADDLSEDTVVPERSDPHPDPHGDVIIGTPSMLPPEPRLPVAPPPAQAVTMGGDPPYPPAQPVTMGGDPPYPPAQPVARTSTRPTAPAMSTAPTATSVKEDARATLRSSEDPDSSLPAHPAAMKSIPPPVEVKPAP